MMNIHENSDAITILASDIHTGMKLGVNIFWDEQSGLEVKYLLFQNNIWKPLTILSEEEAIKFFNEEIKLRME